MSLMLRLNWDKFILITFGLLLGIFLNILLFESLIIGLVFGLAYVWIFSCCFGELFFADKERVVQLVLGGLFLVVLLILFGAAGYYLYSLDNWVMCLVLMLIAWIVFLFRVCRPGIVACGDSINKDLHTTKARTLVLRKFSCSLFKNFGKRKIFITLYSIVWLVCILMLFNYQTIESIRSPWEVVPKAFILLYFVACLVVVVILLKNGQGVSADTEGTRPKKSNKLVNLILVSLHFFLTLSVVLIVYKIGYGFDGFVHRATEKVIYEAGVIQPKPFYYIGQYSLVVVLSKLLMLKLSVIDRLLIPILASIFLPALAYFSLKNIFGSKKLLQLTTCGLLIVATPLFFYSVPQGLANLLLLLLILLAIPYLVEKRVMPYFLWLIALAVMITHPLAGIPALIFVSLLYVLSKRQFKHPLLLSLYGLGTAVCIPVFFWLGSLFNSQLTIKLSASNLVHFKSIFSNFLNYLPFHSIYHLVYFYRFNFLVLFFAVVIIGAIYLVEKKHSGIVLIYFLLAGLLLINLFLMGFLEFSSLINYEQGEFMRRLGQIVALFLLPMFLSGVYIVVEKISSLRPYRIFSFQFPISKKYPRSNIEVTGRVLILLLTAGFLTMGLYLSYPHVDAFEKTRGYSVSQADIDAVRWIEENAGGADYVVLANQATSAAALQEYGFRKYYKTISNAQLTTNKENTFTDLFYYPIPTSSPLYDLYLKMVYDEPKLEYIQTAQDLTGASLVYFVMNDYWLDASKRVEQAKLIADEWRDVDDGRVWVFRFEP